MLMANCVLVDIKENESNKHQVIKNMEERQEIVAGYRDKATKQSYKTGT